MEDRWKTAKPAEELKEKEQRYSIDSCMTMVMISLHEKTRNELCSTCYSTLIKCRYVKSATSLCVLVRCDITTGGELKQCFSKKVFEMCPT